MEVDMWHKRFEIGHSLGISGAECPTYSGIDEELAIDLQKANELVKHFLDNTELDFQCVYNGCQNRAMLMSLILKRENIAHCKVWNFDPIKVGLYNKPNKLNMDDPLNLKDNIYWDYHVAILILVKNEKKTEVEEYVIDPAFVHSVLRLSKWLHLSNSKRSYYTFLDPEWYEPVELTSDSSIICNNKSSQLKLADCFPAIITGDFYKYSPKCNKTIADELAADKQITTFTHNVFNNLRNDAAEKHQLAAFLTDYTKFDPVLNGEKEIDSSHAFYPYLSEYRNAYRKLYEYWLNKLESF